MLEQRNLQADLTALAALALAAFLALALVTYDPADPPASLVYPLNAQTQNTCGPLGAWSAFVLLEALGVGAYFAVGSLLTVALVMLRAGQLARPVVRGLGWALALMGLTTLAAVALPSWSPGPVVGAGGYLGAAGRGMAEAHLAGGGTYLASVSLLAIGLLLATGYTMVRWCACTTSGTWRMLCCVPMPRLPHLPRVRLSLGRAAAAEDEDEEDEDHDERSTSAGPRVRIRGKRSDVDELELNEQLAESDADEEVDALEEDEDEAAELDEESEELAVEEPVASGKSSKSRAAQAAPTTARQLRIKKHARSDKRDDRQEMMQQLDAASRRENEQSDYELPPLDMLLESESVNTEDHEREVRRKAKILEKTFANFGFNVKVVEIETGPVIAQYEVELEAGLRLSKITSLADDLAIALRVPSVRIVAPIPGKNTVGIEVPNEERQLVRLREVIEEANEKTQKMRIPIYLGKDVSGNPMVADLTTLPHLLIAGRTGTGKSVCLNTLIVSMLMTRRPDEVRMLLIDPKMVELSPYKTLPHLMHPVVTDMRKAEAILAWAVEKMEERYALLARAGVRHISGYNGLGEEELMERLQPESDEERQNIPTHLPYIVIVADEMADLMMTAAKEVETHIIRLAQKSRAVGIHLVLATQKPTVDVITGLIKSNLPARIAFQVASRTDSRVVLDEMGADKLLGNGDMLFLWPGTSTLLRGQGTYVSDEEITQVVDFVGTTQPEFVKELVALKPKSEAGEGGSGGDFKQRDELYESAIEVVVREGRGSVSLLQRALGVGYGRGARLIDFMAEDGIVGSYNGSQAREVLITLEQWEDMCAANSGGSSGSGSTGSGSGGKSSASGSKNAAPPPPRRSNKIRPEPEAVEDSVDEEDEEDEELVDETGEEYEDSDDYEEEDDDADEDSGDDSEYDEEDEQYEDDEYEEAEEDEFEEVEAEQYDDQYRGRAS